MFAEAHLSVRASPEALWAVITDIEHAAETIRGIEKVELLERPSSGLVGLKWRETRTLFGKTATEVMWITDAVENQFYQTRAESHGCIYVCTVGIAQQPDGCRLSMSMDARPQSIVARLLSIPMSLLVKGAVRKAFLDDLNDIKAAVEQRPNA
jgi:hypothetical protein